MRERCEGRGGGGGNKRRRIERERRRRRGRVGMKKDLVCANGLDLTNFIERHQEKFISFCDIASLQLRRKQSQ